MADASTKKVLAKPGLPPTHSPVTEDFLKGGGEMGALMRTHDWTTSSLGAPSTWPQALRTAVRLILNTGHPMYIWWGQDGACLYNDAYRQSIGPERHPGSLGRPAREVWEEIWSIIGPQIEQVQSGRGATWNVNHLVPITRHGKREDVYWTYSYSPIDDDTVPGGIGGVLVVCSETTQQILAARQLAAERDQLSQLFEQAPTFMALLRGPNHQYELANPSYLKLVGYRPVLGKTVAEAIPEAAEQGYLALLDQVFSSGKAYSAKGARYVSQSPPDALGNERYVDFVFQPIKDPCGKVTGIFVEGADVTERTRADEALRESESRFRELVHKLEDENRLKDEFLATLAHELRNPLAPIRNGLELLKIAPEDKHLTATVHSMMDRQLTQLIRLTEDLLDLSRVSRGIVELRRERMSLAAALGEAVETSRPLIEQYGHTLTITQPGEDLIVEADNTRIVQIFANLLNNAAKFTPQGGRIDLSVTHRANNQVAISIRDNGVGISKDMLERIFDMFIQVDRSYDHVGGGIGIGLTLVRRLVEMHGGTVEAHSAGPGTGSEFLVVLPLAAAFTSIDKTDDEKDRSNALSGAGLRIVVADDNVDVADSLAMMLTMIGHEVRAVYSGEQALAVAREFNPHAMVLDIAMPGLNGHELARRVRAENWGAKMLLIAASGWGQDENKQHSYEAGFDCHLVKPFEFKTLVGLLRHHPNA